MHFMWKRLQWLNRNNSKTVHANIDTDTSQILSFKTGFSYDSKAKNERNIKIGDWLKSINNIDVHVHNLDDILQKFINHDEVILTLQRVAATEVTKDPPINKLNLESAFVRDLLNSNSEDEEKAAHKLCGYPIGLVYVNTENLNENNEANEDIIYHYPKPLHKNVLCTSRGIFITLSHLIQDLTKTSPKTSSIVYKGRLAHIVYVPFEEKLLVLMLPDDRVSLREAAMMTSELIRFLQFSFRSLDDCFGNEASSKQVDRILCRYFARILTNDDWSTLSQFMEFQSNQEISSGPNNCLFEDIMPAVPSLKITDDAVGQIDEALSELEASDYREWNEDPLDCQRLFTILGSALFHSGYLLHSHLPYDDLVDIYSFCKLHGLVHLAKTEPVRSLVLWKEIFPRAAANTIGLDKPSMGDCRCYLLVVGSGKDFLTVIMEAGGATEPPEDNMGPDAFYVEEAQATLSHVQALGVNLVAERFLSTNGGYQIATPLPPVPKKKNDFIGSLTFGKSNIPQPNKESTTNPKKSEVISILKRRSSEQNVLNTSHEDSYDGYSEESGSQCYSEGMSEVSDESNGRHRKKYDSNDDDSDLEDFGDGSQISTNSFDLSEVRQALLTESGEFTPVQLTSGPHNTLYHFVHVDTTECVLVTPLECSIQSATYKLIINNFRRCCQKIHGVFQTTLRFKNMPAQDIGKTLMNKSLIAIKEYGMLFECPFVDEKENSKKNRISYWVIGRLFYMPHPKELYVCYQDSLPQNLVQLALKISLNSII